MSDFPDRCHNVMLICSHKKLATLLYINIYNRYRNDEQLNHYVKCNISIKFNKISYKLKAVIINNDHHNNNIIIIEDHQDKSYKKNLISQAYILLFEKDTPLSSQELCRTYGGSHETNSTQSSLGSGSQSQSQSRQKAHFHYAVIRFLHNEKHGNKSQNFKFKELLESEYLKDYNESEIIQFINSLKQFQLDNDGIVHYVKEEM